MVTNIQYTSIQRVLDNITSHPLMRDVTLDQAIRYVIRFISLHGYPKLYQDKEENIEIKDFRGLLPCDLISVTQVKDLHTGICLRAMTDTFLPPERKDLPKFPKDLLNNVKNPKEPSLRDLYIPHARRYREELAFKTQGRVIFTSFPFGHVRVSYKAIPVDENNYPLLIDNETYLAALEAYIKKEVFTVKFDTGKISAAVLQNAQQSYSWLAGQLSEEFNIPSISEMESLTRYYNSLIKRPLHFDNGFKNMSDREYLRNH